MPLKVSVEIAIDSTVSMSWCRAFHMLVPKLSGVFEVDMLLLLQEQEDCHLQLGLEMPFQRTCAVVDEVD